MGRRADVGPPLTKTTPVGPPIKRIKQKHT